MDKYFYFTKSFNNHGLYQVKEYLGKGKLFFYRGFFFTFFNIFENSDYEKKEYEIKEFMDTNILFVKSEDEAISYYINQIDYHLDKG